VGRTRRGRKGPKGADEAPSDRVADSGRVGDGLGLEGLSSDQSADEVLALLARRGDTTMYWR